MKNTKFTKGEWSYNKYQPTDFGIYSTTGSGNDIALVRGSDEEAGANAKLIAQAPALYIELLNAINSMQKLLSISNLDEKTRLMYKMEIRQHEQVINEINQ